MNLEAGLYYVVFNNMIRWIIATISNDMTRVKIKHVQGSAVRIIHMTNQWFTAAQNFQTVNIINGNTLSFKPDATSTRHRCFRKEYSTWRSIRQQDFIVTFLIISNILCCHGNNYQWWIILILNMLLVLGDLWICSVLIEL